jgi:hypothetical protein
VTDDPPAARLRRGSAVNEVIARSNVDQRLRVLDNERDRGSLGVLNVVRTWALLLSDLARAFVRLSTRKWARAHQPKHRSPDVRDGGATTMG